MAQVQLNSSSGSNAGYTVSSSSSSSHATLSPNRTYPSLNRGRGLRYRPASTNSLASNYSSLSSLSTMVHPSSIYENKEGIEGRVSRYYYSLSVDQFDDADTSIPDAYDEDRFDDTNHNYGFDETYDEPGEEPFLYYDTSTIEEALPFHVLAVYDFTDGDPDNMLLFQKGDLLEIISVQPSGWWAAQLLDDEAGLTKQSGEGQDRVGWIPSAFVNVIPTHLLQRLKDTPREHRISIYNRGELVESPEDIDSLLQSWGLDFDTLDRDGERGAEAENEVTEDAIQEAVDNILQHESHISIQAPTHAPAGPRRRPLPAMPTSSTNGRSNTPPQLTAVLTEVKPSTSNATTTTMPNAPTFISPVQPSPMTPIPPNVPAPAPFSLGRRGSLGTPIRQRDKDRDLPPSLPPPDTPLPPLPALPEVAEVEIEIPVPDLQQQNKLPPYKHQRSTSASTIGTSPAPSTGSHKRTISPLPTPPTTAKAYETGAAAGGTQSTSSLASTAPGSASTGSSHSSATTMTTPLSAPSTSLRFPIKDKPMPPTPRPLPELNTANSRERSNSATDSTRSRSASPPNSALSASGDDGHPSVLVTGNTDAAGSHPHTHVQNASVSSTTTTHSRSSSSISSLSFLPRNRSSNGPGPGGGSHNVISSTISSSLSSLRRKAAKYGPGGGGGGGSSGGLSGASTAAASETINITSSPKHIPQMSLNDETGSGGSTPGVEFEEDFDDDDSVIAATKRQRGPAGAIASVQAGDKKKLRKLLGDDALYFLNAAETSGAGTTAANGAPVRKGSDGSSANGPSTSTGKANAGAFARRRREIKRQSQESDSSFGVNGKRSSASSFPGTSTGSALSTPLSASPNLASSGGPVSHLDLGFPQDDIDIELENDDDTELDADIGGGQTQAFKSFTPLSDEPRTPGVRSRSPRAPRTPRTPQGTPRAATGLPGVAGGKSDKLRRWLGDDDAQAFHNAKQALATQPWYLKPERDVESGEIKLEHDGSVKYGSVEALVERLTVPFLKSDLERKFRHVFLLTFHSFTNAERVLELLIEKYEMPEPRGLSDEEFDEWKDKKLRPTRARVLHVFTLWVDNYGLIQDDSAVIPRLQSFLELVQEPPQNAQIARLILQNIENKRWTDINLPALESVAAIKRSAKLFKAKTDILQSDHGEVARQLTLYEARLYLKIRPHECFKFAANQKAEGISNLRAFIATNDRIASWVKMSVLSNDPLGKRADVIQFWIRVAERCRAMNNFSSTAAIVAALTSQVIARLQLTWAHVSRTNRIEPLVKIFETTNNFASYRNTLMTVDSACVPYIGIFLSDMVKISEGFPDPPKLTIPAYNASTPSTSNSIPTSSTSTQETREVKLISFSKYSKMEDVAQMVLKFQPKVRDSYKLVEVVPIMQYVESQLSLAATKDENEFWTRSQALQRSELAHVDIRKGLELAGF